MRICFVFHAPFAEKEPRIQKMERERVGELFETDEGIKGRYKLFIEWTKQYDYFKDPRSFSRHNLTDNLVKQLDEKFLTKIFSRNLLTLFL